MTDSAIIRRANRLLKPYGLKASWIADASVRSVGVQGDERTCTRPISIVGPFPGHATLVELSTSITNILPVNRVVYELGRRPLSRRRRAD